ncbi:MAG TPA: hypothetical protein VF828_04495 [Patescibacteria group bacterium]
MANNSQACDHCLWKKVMLNRSSTTSKDTDPYQKHKCELCCGSQKSGLEHNCHKFLKDIRLG